MNRAVISFVLWLAAFIAAIAANGLMAPPDFSRMNVGYETDSPPDPCKQVFPTYSDFYDPRGYVCRREETEDGFKSCICKFSPSYPFEIDI